MISFSPHFTLVDTGCYVGGLSELCVTVQLMYIINLPIYN